MLPKALGASKKRRPARWPHGGRCRRGCRTRRRPSKRFPEPEERALRILHVVPTYLPATRYGGPIYSVHGLCRALAARSHDVHVFTTNVDGPGVSDVPLDGPVDLDGVTVSYFSTGPGRRLYRSPAMRRALRKECKRFDIVHLHSVFLWPTTAAAKAARDAGVPYVLAPRGMLVGDLIERKSRLLKTAWIRLFERRNIERAAAVHFTSRLEADDMTALGIRCRRAATIPNGIDFPEMAPDGGAGLIETPPQPFLLYLGRINWKKGLDRLIAAMRQVEHMSLVIAGNDEEGYQQTLVSLARELGVAEKITFVGPVTGPQKWALLRQAQMLVLTSHSENFGIVVLEAMAAGRPVIVSAQVGLAAAVQAAGAGLVVNGEPDQIAAAIVSLATDETVRKKMGEAGKRAAETQFSWAGIAAAVEELYAECVRTRGSDPAQVHLPANF